MHHDMQCAPVLHTVVVCGMRWDMYSYYYDDGRMKVERRGANNGLIQCSKCRTPATPRDPDDPKNTHNYVGGYLAPFMILLDIARGQEFLLAGDRRLRVNHDSIVEQGKLLEGMEEDIRNGGLTTKEELDTARRNTGSRGLSVPVKLLPYTDATLLYDYPICHMVCLGLYPAMLKHTHDVLGPRFLAVIRMSDAWVKTIRRPSEMKRPFRNLLPASSDNICSGMKIEDELHHMENYGQLTLMQCFEGDVKLFLHR